MKLKHEIPNKFDYMKVHSGNFILKERTNCELEHLVNVGKINPKFYEVFSRQHQGEINDRPIIIESQKIDFVSSSTDNDKKVQKEEQQEKHVTFKKTDYSGISLKKYTSTCYLKPISTPTWYSESLLININSTRRRFEEKIYFKHKLHPYYWSEEMITQANQPQQATKNFSVSSVIQVEDSGDHYISLEPQQDIVKRVLTCA